MLWYLEPKQLFLIYRVNKFFRTLINNSEILQRTMILRYSPDVLGEADAGPPRRLVLSSWARDYLKRLHLTDQFYAWVYLGEEEFKPNQVDVGPRCTKTLFGSGSKIRRRMMNSLMDLHSKPGSWRETKLTTIPCRVKVQFGFGRIFPPDEIVFLKGEGTLGDLDECMCRFRHQIGHRTGRAYMWQGGELQPV